MNTISLSAVETAIPEEFRAALGARTGRPRPAAEIAEVIVFPAGPESAGIKGSDIPADGGISAMCLGDTLGL